MELASLLPIIAIGLVFWLLLIRPASKRQKQQQRMQSALAVGDRVILTSGIIGVLEAVEATDSVLVRIADDVVIQVVRGAIGRVVEPQEIQDRQIQDRQIQDRATEDRATKDQRADDETAGPGEV